MNDRLIIHKNQESPDVLVSLEKILLDRRGFIFKKPSDNEPIIFIFSGGLDSTTSLFRLLNESSNEIYPLYIQRGARAEKNELQAARYYIGLFRKSFPQLKELCELKAEVPPKQFKKHIPKTRLDTIGHSMRNSMLQSYGVQYAVSLSAEHNIAARTVYTATSPDDTFPHSSLTALRALTILSCIDSGDWRWQIISPLLEADLWGDVSKADSIKYAFDRDLDLSRTYSCTSQSG